MKKLKFMLLVSVFGGILLFTKIDAVNDNIAYKMHIQMLNANSHAPKRYRGTTNPKNTWKVNLVTSGEGAKSITRFWLEESKWNKNVSPTVDAKQVMHPES